MKIVRIEVAAMHGENPRIFGAKFLPKVKKGRLVSSAGVYYRANNRLWLLELKVHGRLWTKCATQEAERHIGNVLY